MLSFFGIRRYRCLFIIDIGGGLLDYQRRNDMDMALAPDLPPHGLTNGKTIVPRARRNLPAGIRYRFGKEVIANA